MKAKGFTLLEVMVALAIFATAAVALTKLGMQYTQSTANAILRTKAQFVAMNEVTCLDCVPCNGLKYRLVFLIPSKIRLKRELPIWFFLIIRKKRMPHEKASRFYID